MVTPNEPRSFVDLEYPRSIFELLDMLGIGSSVEVWIQKEFESIQEKPLCQK